MANYWIEKMKQIAEALGLLKSTMTRLTDQRDAARTALEKARAALKTHLLGVDGGDQKAIAALKAEIVSERELITALDDAIETQNALVVAEENRLVDEETRKQRTAASEAILADVAQIERQLAPWLAATRQLATSLKKYESFRTECSGIAEFIGNCANESELALSISIPDLRSAALAVLQGTERAPVAPGVVVQLARPAPTPTTQRMFLTQSLAWFDGDGGKHRAAAMNDTELPLDLIGKARSLGAAHDLHSDMRKKNAGSKTSAPPDWNQVKWLNDNPKTKSSVAPIMQSSPFEKHPNVPERYDIIVPSQPIAATRSWPTKK
jgi:hypothetical protein